MPNVFDSPIAINRTISGIETSVQKKVMTSLLKLSIAPSLELKQDLIEAILARTKPINRTISGIETHFLKLNK